MIRIIMILIAVWGLGLAAEPIDERYIVVKAALHVGMPEIALAELENLPENRRDADYWLQRGQALQRLGRFEEAIAAFSEGIRKRPKDAAGYNGIGLAYSEAGDLASGAAYLLRATKLAPMEAQYYLDLAKTRILQGKYEEAQKRLKTALRLGGGGTVAKLLGQTLALQGEEQRARELLMRYYDMHEVYFHLAEAYELGGDLAAAISHYRMALLAVAEYPAASARLERLIGTTP